MVHRYKKNYYLRTTIYRQKKKNNNNWNHITNPEINQKINKKGGLIIIIIISKIKRY